MKIAFVAPLAILSEPTPPGSAVTLIQFFPASNENYNFVWYVHLINSSERIKSQAAEEQEKERG